MTCEEVVCDVKRVAALYGKESITAKEYSTYGYYSSSALIRNIGAWNKILTLAGMPTNLNRNFSDEDLFEEIERIWIMLGRQPTSTDIKNGLSKFSLQSYARRFGGWRGALQAFVDYINLADGKDKEKLNSENIMEERQPGNSHNVASHNTSREVNLRLRFQVFQRDNFKCCVCGASPAKDPSVVLHVDHIIPWAKGGETVINNLQTLCSKCNLGKSDLILD